MGWIGSGLRERFKLGLKTGLYRLHRRISATQTWIRMSRHIAPSSQQLEISVDPLTHQIRLIHPQFILSEQQPSPGDSTPSNNFIQNRLTILTLILFIFVVEMIFLGWFYGPSVWQYFRSKQKAKGSMFTRKPQRRGETPSRRTPFPDLEVETVVG